MAFFGDTYAGRGKLEVLGIEVKGMNRFLLYMKRIQANLPMLTKELTTELANNIKDYAKANVIARSKYIDRDRRTERHPRGELAKAIQVGKQIDTPDSRKTLVEINKHSPAYNYAAAVEFGRKGGKTIKPKYKDALSFKWSKGPLGELGTLRATPARTYEFSGRHAFAKVKQGASKPMYFMRDAVVKGAEEIRMKIEQETGREIKRK